MNISEFFPDGHADEDNSGFDVGRPYVSFHYGEKEICLDGQFTKPQLIAILLKMETPKPS